MIPAVVTPVYHRLRRITFIVCIAVGLFSCTHIPDQDATILLDARKPGDYFEFECNKAYDTTKCTLTCIIRDKKEQWIQDMPVTLMQGQKSIRKLSRVEGYIEFGWLNPGIYTVAIGEPGKYPYLVISGVELISGRGCELKVKWPH